MVTLCTSSRVPCYYGFVKGWSQVKRSKKVIDKRLKRTGQYIQYYSQALQHCFLSIKMSCVTEHSLGFQGPYAECIKKTFQINHKH